MQERKRTTVLLTVIGIATLLVSLVGATFAYFTATITDNNPKANDITVTTAKLGTITFTHGSEIKLENAVPGNYASTTFTIAAADGATSPVDYEIYLVTDTNTFTDHQSGVENGNTGDSNLIATLSKPENGTLQVDNQFITRLDETPLNNNDTDGPSKNFGKTNTPDGILIGSGIVEPTKTDSWTLKVQLRETGEAQDFDQGKSYSAKILVKTDSKYTAKGAKYLEG